MEKLSIFCKNLYAHPEKPLREHLKNTGNIMRSVVNTIQFNVPDLKKDILKEVCYLIGVYHDFGKATKFFQDYLVESSLDKKNKLKNQKETKHSLLSAIATYYAVEKYLKENGIENDWKDFLLISSFIVVRRHHTNLISILDDLSLEDEEILKKQVDNLCSDYLKFLPHFEYVFDKLKTLESWSLRKFKLSKWLDKERGSLPSLILQLIYSILLDADKHETVLNRILERTCINSDLIDNYRTEMNFDNPKNDIDKLRNEIYLQVVRQVPKINLNKDRIMSFTAPTGGGKTLSAVSFAIKLRERIKNELGYSPRIIYCLPFLSIIDQNAKVMEEVFEVFSKKKPTSDILLVHHHLSDYSYKTYENEYDVDESEILIEGWDSEIIITTFVQFFHTLFSNNKKSIRKFNKIVGSIVILDEIQSFPHKYWLLFREVSTSLSEYFNTYFILTTATQPAIFEFTTEILEGKGNFFQKLNRTKIRFNIDREFTIHQLAEKLIGELKDISKNMMVVLNTIKSAEMLYKLVKKELINKGFEVLYLSSHIVPYERRQRIQLIKKSPEKKFLITTQVVEAGVDLDFEKIIRDLGPMDSINQVAGRANRNWQLKKGEVEIIRLIDENNKNFYSYIYDAVLVDCTKKLIKEEKEINEENFLSYVESYFKRLKDIISNDYSKEYIECIQHLYYDKIGNFKLINEKEKIDIFIELNEKASEYWNKYQEIVTQTQKNILERKCEFNKIKSEFYQYVVSISSEMSNIPPEINGFYFVSKDKLVEYYDSETGYITKKGSMIW
ncbi:MAG TPA: CRISPR-associated helicase Cas3' [bacterium]|nr:CRISPR-associated helicase Cas3' [bacterium]HPP29785.1 CRISPR-associated helicase Cas3' [bacterium]